MSDDQASAERKESELGAAPQPLPGSHKASAPSEAAGRPADPAASDNASAGAAPGDQDSAAAHNVVAFPAGEATPSQEPGAQVVAENPLARLGQTITQSFRHGERRECLTTEEVQEFRQAARSATTTDENVRQELSLALGLAQRIRSRNCMIDSAYERIKFIFDCLTAEPPKLVLAVDERLRLQVELYRQAGVISRTLAGISSGSPAGLVLAALAASSVIWGVLVLGIHFLAHRGPPADSQVDSVLGEIFFMNGKMLSVMVTAAFVGGVVSIATRLGEFSKKRDLDPFAMFWTALLKPLIGAVLSLFMLATLAAGIISFEFLGDDPFKLKTGIARAVIEPKVLYMLWVLGFLAGFSERFAWDFVDRTERATGGAPKKTS